jgi:NAD(P)-dependent dehydrogenase (short-subunit alcohol dehydrogenase family)
MRILFVHQNFPGQFRHTAIALAADKANQVVALCINPPAYETPGVTIARYQPRRTSAKNVHPLAADLADAEAVTHLPGEAMALAGRAPSLLVNCAALFREDKIMTVSASVLDAHLAVNLAAPVLLTRALADLGEGEASVVQILDQRVLNPVPDQLSYTLSKQALHAAVRTLARSLAPRIRVNAVAPGLTLPTPDYSDAQWARLTAMMPLERLADPTEIAEAVVFLAKARAITGQTIFVDGGAHLESYARDFVYLAQ